MSANRLKDESGSLVKLLISSFGAQNLNLKYYPYPSVPQWNTGLWTVEPIAFFANNSMIHSYT